LEDTSETQDKVDACPYGTPQGNGRLHRLAAFINTDETSKDSVAVGHRTLGWLGRYMPSHKRQQAVHFADTRII
jgi:hypothetical protein